MNIKFFKNIFLVSFISFAFFALSPVETGVFFENIKDGQKVSSPFLVKMKVIGKTVAQAGDPAPNTGHHHIIVDGTFMEQGEIIPADATHIHYGKGQTEAELSLPKGLHTLTLQFADMNHLSFGQDWSRTVKIEVE